MTIIILILLLLLGALFYYYILLLRPPRPIAAPPKIKGITHLFSIYGYGTKPEEQLKEPHGVAVDEDGKIYVADTGNHRILVFDRNGKFLAKFGKEGLHQGEMKNPLRIAVAPNGNIYVTVKNLNKIMIFDSRYKLIKEVKGAVPLSLTVARGRLYVTTYGHIAIFDLEGNLLERWGKRGKAPGEFDFPSGIAVDKKGNVCVSDGNNMRLQALDRNGEVIWVVGKPPRSMYEQERKFSLPGGLVLDEKENLYLVDTFAGTIRIFTPRGKQLAELGDWGGKEGQLQYPDAIAYAGKNTFVVADTLNNRVQVFRIAPPEGAAKK